MKTKAKLRITNKRIKELVKLFRLNMIPSFSDKKYFTTTGMESVKFYSSEALYQDSNSYDIIKDMIKYHSKNTIDISKLSKEITFVLNFYKNELFKIFIIKEPDKVKDFGPIEISKKYLKEFHQEIDFKNHWKRNNEKIKRHAEIKEFIEKNKLALNSLNYSIDISSNYENVTIRKEDFSFLSEYALIAHISDRFINDNFKNNRLSDADAIPKENYNIKDVFILNILNGIRNMGITFKINTSKNSNQERKIGKNYMLFELLIMLKWELSYSECESLYKYKRYELDNVYDYDEYYNNYINLRIQTLLHIKKNLIESQSRVPTLL